jgi:hypothetical protein
MVEDLPFAAWRRMYNIMINNSLGGVEPLNLVSFSSSFDFGFGVSRCTFENYIHDAWVCNLVKVFNVLLM